MRCFLMVIAGLSLSVGVAFAVPPDEDPVAMAQFEQNVAQASQTSQPAVAVSSNAAPNVYQRAPSVSQLLDQSPNQNQQEAYQGMLQDAMPMTPGQIVELKRRIAAAQLASSASVGNPPKPVTSSQIVNLAPGAIPPVIRLEKGFITTLDFVDASGEPWPVSSIDNGNPDAYNVSWDKQGNSFMIQARKEYTSGNIAVLLKGLSTPIMLTLLPGQTVVDYRVDLRVPGVAPGGTATLSSQSTLPKSTDQALLNVLNGIPPAGGQSVIVDGGDAQAWLVGGNLYLRTRFSMLSPGWVGEMSSPDGTYAYVLPKTPSILVSEYGTPVQFKIEGV